MEWPIKEEGHIFLLGFYNGIDSPVHTAYFQGVNGLEKKEAQRVLQTRETIVVCSHYYILVHIVHKPLSSTRGCTEVDISWANKCSGPSEWVSECHPLPLSLLTGFLKFLVSTVFLHLGALHYQFSHLSSFFVFFLVPLPHPQQLVKNYIIYQFTIFRYHGKHNSVSHWRGVVWRLSKHYSCGNSLSFSVSLIYVCMHVFMYIYAHLHGIYH